MASVEELDSGSLANVLEWLAKAFWDVPSEALVSAFDDGTFKQAGFSLEAVGSLADAVAGIHDEAAAKDARVDFTGLLASTCFDAPHPYESVYAAPGRLAMRACRDEVLAAYRKAGFEPPQGEAREPEDHVSQELRFAAFLLHREEPASAGAFTRDHMATWIPAFCADVREQAVTPLYLACADALDEAVSALAGI